jgi:uncharacterized DUF497 family protein
MLLRFEWDRQKAAKNLHKHSVSFDEASTVFSDPLALIFDDEDHSDNEAREIIIGHSAIGRLVLVSFTEKTANTIRIISARSTTNKERDDYEENQHH